MPHKQNTFMKNTFTVTFNMSSVVPPIKNHHYKLLQTMVDRMATCRIRMFLHVSYIVPPPGARVFERFGLQLGRRSAETSAGCHVPRQHIKDLVGLMVDEECNSIGNTAECSQQTWYIRNQGAIKLWIRIWWFSVGRCCLTDHSCSGYF